MTFYKKLRIHTYNFLHNTNNKPIFDKKIDKDFSEGYYMANSTVISGSSSIKSKKYAIEEQKKNIRSKDPKKATFAKGYINALKDYSSVNIVTKDKKWMENEKWNELNTLHKRRKKGKY